MLSLSGIDKQVFLFLASVTRKTLPANEVRRLRLQNTNDPRLPRADDTRLITIDEETILPRRIDPGLTDKHTVIIRASYPRVTPAVCCLLPPKIIYLDF